MDLKEPRLKDFYLHLTRHQLEVLLLGVDALISKRLSQLFQSISQHQDTNVREREKDRMDIIDQILEPMKINDNI